MAQTAIRDQILRDLEKLSPDVQRRVRELVRAMVAVSDDSARDDVLRFAIEHPFNPRPAAATAQAATRAESFFERSLKAEPDDVLREIRALIAEGQVLGARSLAMRAAARFPDHAEIRSAARIFDDDGAAVAAGGPEPNTDDEFEWLRNPPEWARGKWVALLAQKVVASGETLTELVESLKTMNLPRQPLVHRID